MSYFKHKFILYFSYFTLYTNLISIFISYIEKTSKSHAVLTLFIYYKFRILICSI